MEVVVVILVVILLLGAYRKGRTSGYHSGYFQGHTDGRNAAKMEMAKKRYSSHETVRIARAAFNRGYRKGVEEANGSAS